MSRVALVLASAVAAIAGLVAGAVVSARIYYVNVVLEVQATDDGASVIDDVTVLKQLRFGDQLPDAIRYLERRLEDDLARLPPRSGEPSVPQARERAVRYLLKYRPYPGARRP